MDPKTAGVLEGEETSSSRSADNSEVKAPTQFSTNCSNSTNLVIIDNIRESWKYKNSSTIKREFARYFKDVKLQLAYSLKAGGVALHLANKESTERVLRFVWPNEAFNNSGSQLLCHSASNKPKVILKNVDTILSEKEVEDITQKFIAEKVSVKRFHYRDTGKRLPVVKVTCSETAAHLLLTKYYSIRGRNIKAEKFEITHRREITCYSCGERGHIARSCRQLITTIES